MKVLFIHTGYKFKGGEDSVVVNEINLLKSKGYRVELLEFTNKGNSLLKFLFHPFNLFSYWKTRKKLKKFRPDIVHLHNIHFAASASVFYAIKKSNTPFVMTLHNYRLLCPSAILFQNGKLFLNSLKQHFPWDAVKQGVYRNSKLLTFWLAMSTWFHKKIGTWQMCNRYIVLTEHAKNIFLTSGLKLTWQQIAVKANFTVPVDKIGFSNEDYFLYVGRLSEEKGIQVVLDAFAGTDFRIKIAGDGPLKEQVEKLSQQYVNIEYLGIASREEVFSLLSRCSAVVFPSICFESMPLTIIEAFSCGIPVIASKLGAMESIITNDYNGLFFDPGNAQDLKEKIKFWQRVPKKKKDEYRANTKLTYDQHYTDEINFNVLASIYDSVLHAQKGSLKPAVSVLKEKDEYSFR